MMIYKSIPLLLTLISAIGGIGFKWARLSKYLTILSLLLFIFEIFMPSSSESVNWFSLGKLDFGFSLNFERTSLIICTVILAILSCIYIAQSSIKHDDVLKRKFGLISLFVFFMCFSVLSGNIFQFFIGIESLGLISAMFVSFEKDSKDNAVRVFVLNKFSSLMFLIGSLLIAVYVGSFDFSKIHSFCDGNKSFLLFIPSCFLLISCFCKGALLPFSFWLLDSVQANIFASIIIHAATIVAIGIIFISKCYFLFELFPVLKNLMIIFGSITAVWMSIYAMTQNNIKKIIVCLTCCSSGIMFVCCGIGEYSLSILYFICHAFFKALFFLSFFYVSYALSGEQNILKMGGISQIIPKINDAVWISFLASCGFPFVVSFFAKISLMTALQLSGNSFLGNINIIVNIFYISAMFRVILLSMYGKSRADEAILSRVTNMNSVSVSSVWFLFCYAALCSFSCWSLYEWGELDFGYGGVVFTREFFDYFIENITEILEILIAVSMTIFFIRHPWFKKIRKAISPLDDALQKNVLHNFLPFTIKKTVVYIFSKINLLNVKINNIFRKGFFYMAYSVAYSFQRKHKNVVDCHLLWILIGILFNLLFFIYWKVS